MKQKKPPKDSKDKLLEKREELAAKGINLREHCEAHDINYQSARDLLCGKSRGRRGDSHRAAVFLGLKPNPEKLAA